MFKGLILLFDILVLKKISNDKLIMNEYKYKIKKYKKKIKKLLGGIDVYEIDVSEKLKQFLFKNENEKNIDISKIKMSNVAKFSVTDRNTADFISLKIKEHMKKLGYKMDEIVITDGTANVGGNTISLAIHFNNINAVELDKKHCSMLKNNLEVFGVIKKVNIICNDYLKEIEKLEQDVIHLDLPWGGPNYKLKDRLNLYLGETNLIDIVNKIKNNNLAKLVVLKVPNNYDTISFINNVAYKTIKIYKMKKFLYLFVE